MIVPVYRQFLWARLADVTLTIASLDVRAEADTAKAYIAGFDGETGTEYLDWGLQVAEAAIQKARAKTTFLIVIHDGQPGWYAHDGRTDAALSLARLQRLARNPRIVPIGIFLGDKLPTGSILE